MSDETDPRTGTGAGTDPEIDGPRIPMRAVIALLTVLTVGVTVAYAVYVVLG